MIVKNGLKVIILGLPKITKMMNIRDIENFMSMNAVLTVRELIMVIVGKELKI